MTPFGDLDPGAFRSEAHRLVDWISRYLEGAERYPVLSRVRPGEIRDALPASPPARGRPAAGRFTFPQARGRVFEPAGSRGLEDSPAGLP